MSDPTTDATAASDAPAPIAEPSEISNADLLAGLEELDRGEPAAEPEAEGDAEESTDETAEDDAEESDEDAEETEDESDEDAAEEADDTDPETAKRLEAIQQNAKRSREQLDEYKAKADAELQQKAADLERKYAPIAEKAEKYDKALARAHVNPAGVLDSLNLDAEAKLEAARQLYTAAMAEKGDPKYKDAAQRMTRERETMSKQQELEKRLEETNARLEQAEHAREFDTFYSKAEGAATDETPVMAAIFKNDPNEARQLVQVALDYQRQQGQKPDAGEALRLLEEHEAARLKARGIAIPSAKKANPKNKTQEAGERKTAKKQSTKGTQSNNSPPQDGPITNEQLKRELEALG